MIDRSLSTPEFLSCLCVSDPCVEFELFMMVLDSLHEL